MSFFSTTPRGPRREPTAEQRQAARVLHELYVSYTEAGFSRVQAMQMVLTVLAANVQAGRQRFGDGS